MRVLTWKNEKNDDDDDYDENDNDVENEAKNINFPKAERLTEH